MTEQQKINKKYAGNQYVGNVGITDKNKRNIIKYHRYLRSLRNQRQGMYGQKKRVQGLSPMYPQKETKTEAKLGEKITQGLGPTYSPVCQQMVGSNPEESMKIGEQGYFYMKN